MLLSGDIATVNKRILMVLIVALTVLKFTADLIVEFNPSFSSPKPAGLETILSHLTSDQRVLREIASFFNLAFKVWLVQFKTAFC